MQANNRGAPGVGSSRAQAVQAAWVRCPGSCPQFEAENVHATLKWWPGKVLAVSWHTLFQGPETWARPGPHGNSWNVGSALEKVFLGTSVFQKGESSPSPSLLPHPMYLASGNIYAGHSCEGGGANGIWWVEAKNAARTHSARPSLRHRESQSRMHQPKVGNNVHSSHPSELSAGPGLGPGCQIRSGHWA